MRHRGPSWLFSFLLLAVLFPLAADCTAAGIPGAESPEQVLMNEYPVLPPDARKKFELTAQDPTAAADLGVSDFFQLVADILDLNIVMADKSKLEGRRVGIVMRDMTIEEAVRLVLQMNDLKAVHFNENTIIVMDQGSKAAYGTKQVQTFRLQHTTIDKVREFINLNKNTQRQLGDNISFDATNNSIIAVDSRENLALLGMVISQLDIPPAKVLEGVKLSFLDFTQFTALARTLGSDIVNRLAAIGLSYNQQSRQLMVYGTPQDVRLIRNLVAKLDVAPKQVLIDTSFLQVSESFNREFGFKFTNSSISVHQFDRIKDLDRIRAQTEADGVLPTRTQINYLIQKTGAKTLQSPKVRAVDRTAATINIGEIRNIQIQSTATTLGTGLTPGQQQTTFNTQEVPIGVQVNVTPEIHNDDSVTLDMKISVTKVLEIKSFGVDRTTQDSTTKLRIRNGETVVLGGFINQVLNTDDTPLPIIGEIPLLSKFFRNKKRERTDSELVFLLTPYILDFQGRNPNPDPFELKAPTVQAEGPAAQEAPAAGASIPIDPSAPAATIGSAGKSAAASAPAGHAALDRGLMPEGVLPLGDQLAELPKAVKTTTTRVVESEQGSAKVVFDDGGHVLAKEFTPGKKAAAMAPESETAAPAAPPQAAKVATAMGAPAARISPAPRNRAHEAAGTASAIQVAVKAPAPVEPSRAIESLRAKADGRMAAAVSAARAVVPGEARRPKSLDAVVRQHREAAARVAQPAPAPEELANFRRLVDLAKSSERAGDASRAKVTVASLPEKAASSARRASLDDTDSSDEQDQAPPVRAAHPVPGPGAGSAPGGVRGGAPVSTSRVASLARQPSGGAQSGAPTEVAVPMASRGATQAKLDAKLSLATASQGHGTSHPYLRKLREERLKAKAAAEFGSAVSASRTAPAVTRARPGRVEAAAAAPPAAVMKSVRHAPAASRKASKAPRIAGAHGWPAPAVEAEESYSDLPAMPKSRVIKRAPAAAARPPAASDRELLARLRSLAAPPAPPVRTAASPADRDAALRKRLQDLTATRASQEEPEERLSGSSFEELARQLERQLGTGGV